MAATIKDVARTAGVSTATVSAVINESAYVESSAARARPGGGPGSWLRAFAAPRGGSGQAQANSSPSSSRISRTRSMRESSARREAAVAAGASRSSSSTATAREAGRRGDNASSRGCARSAAIELSSTCLSAARSRRLSRDAGGAGASPPSCWPHARGGRARRRRRRQFRRELPGDELPDRPTVTKRIRAITGPGRRPPASLGSRACRPPSAPRG